MAETTEQPQTQASDTAPARSEMHAAAELAAELDRRRAEQPKAQEPTAAKVDFEALSKRLLKPNPEADRRAREADAAERRQREIEQQNLDAAAWDAVLGHRKATHGSADLQNFECVSEAARRVLDAVQKYRNDLEARVREGCGVVLMGPAGTGKDHLLVGLARVAVKELGLRVRWWNGGQLAAAMRNNIKADDPDKLFHDLLAPKVLYISDPLPPQGALSPILTESYLRFVDERRGAGKPTWISVNAVDGNQMDELMGAPIVDRLCDNALVCKCNWASKRKPREVIQ